MTTERTVKFGTAGILSGVLAEPSPGRARAGAPPVILINSGILHKVGSCRLYVNLARALAAEGIVCLRFDLSGLGDSDVRRDARSFEERAVVEAREAMDYLQHVQHASQFILGGLCSGADVSHMTALEDPRVVGMASIDARTHLTWGYWWHNYSRKLWSFGVWRRWLRQKVAGGRARTEGDATAAPDEQAFELPTYVRAIPPRDELARDLSSIVARRARLLYIFTDGLGNYNHRGQFRSAFHDVPFGELLSEHYLRGSDHIITDLALQRLTVELHVQWAIQVTNALSANALPSPGRRA